MCLRKVTEPGEAEAARPVTPVPGADHLAVTARLPEATTSQWTSTATLGSRGREERGEGSLQAQPGRRKEGSRRGGGTPHGGTRTRSSENPFHSYTHAVTEKSSCRVVTSSQLVRTG